MFEYGCLAIPRCSNRVDSHLSFCLIVAKRICKMIKDYYLILGVSKDATPKEIEDSYKEFESRTHDEDGIASSIELSDIKEAFFVLSQPNLRELYDNELVAFNATEDYANYEIHNQDLLDAIASLQDEEVRGSSSQEESGCFRMGTRGCMWMFIIILLFFLKTCIGAVMKDQGRRSVRNYYSYVIQQNQLMLCSKIIMEY